MSKPSKNAMQAPRGTRDMYPDDMAMQDWLFDAWRQVSQRHGFRNYDGPIFEHLDMFTIKSGDEIASQLFSFLDRGGRDLAIRPELTPTLARMVAAKAESLPKPIKWYSIPRLCRAERPQRGRLREFYQWNIDVIGSDSVVADAECMFVAIDMLRSVGLGPDVIELRVSSRTIMSALLEQFGVTPDRHELVFAVMDKYEKLGRDAFCKFAVEQGLTVEQTDRILEVLALKSLADLEKLVTTDTAQAEFDKLDELQNHLNRMGVGEYFVYSPAVVRGLAYYTGIVFEIFDRASQLRAIAGGGRYDKLIKLFGGPEMPAAGFGMGDVVLMELLRDQNKLPSLDDVGSPDFFLIDAEADLFDTVLETVGKLRDAGFCAEFSYKRQKLPKQFKQANSRRARTVVIIGAETRETNTVTIKNLADGTQQTVDLDTFIKDPTPFAPKNRHA